MNETLSSLVSRHAPSMWYCFFFGITMRACGFDVEVLVFFGAGRPLKCTFGVFACFWPKVTPTGQAKIKKNAPRIDHSQ
jgi:hypothetical protein